MRAGTGWTLACEQEARCTFRCTGCEVRYDAAQCYVLLFADQRLRYAVCSRACLTATYEQEARQGRDARLHRLVCERWPWACARCAEEGGGHDA